ncbi:MAG: ABC transporter ATP-binding protein [Sulfolobus sp.]|nr:ABC transporter ATP-binding protein [Sulfolobus sp.]
MKKFGKYMVLKDVTFNVPEGEIVGLIGPNGAGKTTTIKILSGLSKRDGGVLRVFGEDPWENPRVKSNISVIFSKLPYPPSDSVKEYLDDLSSIYGNDYMEYVEMLNLKPHLKKRLDKLSSGEAQKVQLVSALIKDAKLILADEPTANLDIYARRDFYNLVREMNREKGVTFIISSHILSELEKVITYVVLIDNGIVKRSEKMNKILDQSDEVYLLVDKPELAMKVLSEKRYGVKLEGSYLKVKGYLRDIIDILDDNDIRVISANTSSLDKVFSDSSSSS